MRCNGSGTECTPYSNPGAGATSSDTILDLPYGLLMLRLHHCLEFRLPGIDDLIRVLASRHGVEASVLMGRDGLLIEGRSVGELDPERLAALVPSLFAAADGLADAAQRGAPVSVVVEYERGAAIVLAAGSDALLLVLVRPEADIGALLYELRLHRSNIASLV